MQWCWHFKTINFSMMVFWCGIPNSFQTPQIFPIYEGDPLSPPEGEAAQGVRSPWPPCKIKVLKQHSCPARPRQGGRATPKGWACSYYWIFLWNDFGIGQSCFCLQFPDGVNDEKSDIFLELFIQTPRCWAPKFPRPVSRLIKSPCPGIP